YFVQQELPIDWVQSELGDEHEHTDEVITPDQAGPVLPEPNDTLATATATGLRSATPGTFIAHGAIGDNPNVAPTLDVDLYRFQLNAGDPVHIGIDADTFAIASGLDANLQVFDAAGRQVASNDGDSGSSNDPQLNFIATTTGTYYVGVAGFVNFLYNPTVA